MKENPSASHTAVFHTGIFFLLLSVLPFTIQSVLLLIGVPVNPFVFPACVLAAFANLLLQLKRTQRGRTAVVLSAGSALLLAICTPLICQYVYDFSYDGLWYHQDAVVLLKNGWNPNTQILTLEETSLCDIYLNHYPKATWITEAAFYSLFGILDMSKTLNFYLVYAAFFLAWAIIRNVTQTNRFVSIVFALFIALNPVVICQLFSFYVDGIHGSIITCVICLMVLLITEKSGRWFLHLYLALALIFMANIKFTSLVYACVLMAGYIGYTIVYRMQWMRQVLFYGIVFITGVLVLGYSTYVRNLTDKGHPFYPLMGEGNMGEQIERAGMPADLIGKNRFEQFNIATFARPEWARAPLKSRPKPLFTMEGITSYDVFKRADAEMSGFGPLYAEIFLMLGAGLVLLLIFDRGIFSAGLIWLLGIIIVSVIIIPSFWYARYAPQIWLFSMLLLVLLWKSRKTRWFAVVIMLFVLADTGMVMTQNFGRFIQQTQTLNAALEELKSRPQPPKLHEGWMHSVGIRLKEKGLQYTPIPASQPQDSVVWIPGLEITGAFYIVER